MFFCGCYCSVLMIFILGMKFPTTPPPRRKHLTGIQATTLLTDGYPLTKSKSHESQLAGSKTDNGDANSTK